MKHTPGPWEANHFLVTAKNGREVTHTGLLGRRRSSYPDQDGTDEDEANAQLMSAAPDAHSILLAIHEFFRHNNPAYPSTLFDDDRTLKQAVADYLAKATQE